MLNLFKDMKDLYSAESELKNELRRSANERKESLINEYADVYEKLNKYSDYTDAIIDKLNNNELTDKDMINNEIAKMQRLNNKLNSYEENIFRCFNKQFYQTVETDSYNRQRTLNHDKEFIKTLNKRVRYSIIKLNDALEMKEPVDEFNDDDYNL